MTVIILCKKKDVVLQILVFNSNYGAHHYFPFTLSFASFSGLIYLEIQKFPGIFLKL